MMHTRGPLRLCGKDEFLWSCDGLGVNGESTLTILGPTGYGVLSVPISATSMKDEDHGLLVSAYNSYDRAFGERAVEMAKSDALEKLIALARRIVAAYDGKEDIFEVCAEAERLVGEMEAGE